MFIFLFLYHLRRPRSRLPPLAPAESGPLRANTNGLEKAIGRRSTDGNTGQKMGVESEERNKKGSSGNSK